MRGASFVIAAALAVGVSATATAQTAARSAANHATTAAAGPYYSTENHWLASGFAGTNFGDNYGEDRGGDSVTFGGQIGYLWHGYLGAEALADFTPGFKVPNTILLADDPHLSSYMANGIVAAPFGSHDQFLPYFSAGMGVFHMSTNFVTLDPANSLTGSQGHFGGNVGGGFIGYAGNVGVRGDLRWYNVDTKHDDFTASNARDLFTLRLLSGLEYWRANIGVAFRW
jgi:hypothetical protein